jgi:5'-nucleotidase
MGIVDAGDEWQGTLESNLSQGATVVEFYNRLGVSVAAIGNHEFDFGIANMSKQFAKAKYGYVASNIYRKKSDKRPAWDNFTPSKMIEVAGYHIGVVGFSTQQTPTTTRYENVADLEFRDPLKPVSEEAKAIRSQGANLVLLTAHAGTVCEDKSDLKAWKIWTESTQTSKCDDEQEIYKLATDLKPGLIDGIVSGHTHQIIHHFFNHIPVVQDEAFNQFFNIIYFTFDKSTKKVIPGLTRIEGLVPICLDTFEGMVHCDVRRLPAGVSPALVRAKFHGKVVQNDPAILAWLGPIRESTEKYRNEVVAYAELPLNHFRDKESPFSNLMADVLREKGHTDFALVNSGGIRTSLDAGPITYDGIFRALPFDNLLNVVKMTGLQVKMMYRLSISGTHGYPGISGARITMLGMAQDAPRDDLNHDGKVERWETNRLIKVETSDGKPILDQKIYSVATYDFLVTGGDDMSFIMDQIPKNRIFHPKSGYTRDIATQYMQLRKTINTRANPLVDPKKPRFIVEGI